MGLINLIKDFNKGFLEYTDGKSFFQLLGEDIKNYSSYLKCKRIMGRFNNEPILIHSCEGYFFNQRRDCILNSDEFLNASDIIILEPRAFRTLNDYITDNKIKKSKKTA